MTQIVDADEFHMRRGERSFRAGDPWPDYDHKDRRAYAFWIGYHTARIRSFQEKRRVKQLLGVADD